jgi:signal transduction histidine kinase
LLAQEAEDAQTELVASQARLATADDDARRRIVRDTELRELARGILPTALTRGGLAPAVAALVSRARIPVGVDVADERFAPEVEATAYFVIAEALTNIAKHSGAHEAQVKTWTEDGLLRVDVCDDGAGGARPDGSGLVGLQDRVVSLGGHLRIESPSGGGTRIAATLPLQC